MGFFLCVCVSACLFLLLLFWFCLFVCGGFLCFVDGVFCVHGVEALFGCCVFFFSVFFFFILVLFIWLFLLLLLFCWLVFYFSHSIPLLHSYQ